MTHNVIGVKLPPGARGDPGVSVVPDRPPEGAGPATTPRSIQIGGPRPTFTARTATYPMRRSGAPATLESGTAAAGSGRPAAESRLERVPDHTELHRTPHCRDHRLCCEP